MNHEYTEPSQDRQQWLSLMAKTPLEDLKDQWTHCLKTTQLIPENIEQYAQAIRPIQTGLVQVRGRMGGNGNRFNVGDMTVTRAAINCEGFQGFGYIAGRSKTHANLIALLDALLQNPQYQVVLQSSLLTPLADLRHKVLQTNVEKTAETRVEFFTVVRGED